MVGSVEWRGNILTNHYVMEGFKSRWNPLIFTPISFLIFDIANFGQAEVTGETNSKIYIVIMAIRNHFGDDIHSHTLG